MRPRNNIIVTITLGLIPLFYWIGKYVHADLWYDEAYSLEHFVFGGFSNTLLDYHLPNNHIFFNFIHQLLTRLLNCRDFTGVTDHIYLFRLIQGAIALLTGYYSALTIRRLYHFRYSWLVLVILFTSIPFMNFSLQLRGYNMSSLFLIMTIYYAWSYSEREGRSSGLMLLVSCVMLVYTIPSNLYMLGSVMIPLVVLGLMHRREDREKARSYFKSGLWMILGILIAALFYLPVIHDVVSNEFSSRKPDHVLYSLKLLPEILVSFLSKRYLLIVLFLAAFGIFLKKAEKREKIIFLSFVFMLVFPFVLSFLHQKFPFDRVFVPLSPVFAVVLAIPLIHLLERKFQTMNSLVPTVLVSAYCTLLFVTEARKNDAAVAGALSQRGVLSQDIYQNYYLSAFFNQQETMQYLRSISRHAPILLFNQLDTPSTTAYLHACHLNYRYAESPGDIESAALKSGTVFILTSHKTQTLQQLGNLTSIRATDLSSAPSFTHIVQVDSR